jgi:hypothetical protein
MLGALDAPAELDRAGERGETQANCQGNDACRGTDAGNTLATHINLTDDFSWTGVETISYYGDHHNATSYSTTNDDNNDGYIIDVPVGFAYSVELTWNHTGGGFYDNYAHGVSISPADGCATNWNICDWSYDYNDDSGSVSVSTEPQDLAGDSTVLWAFCYYCYNAATVSDYMMNITVSPADGGMMGDVTTPMTGDEIYLDMPDFPSMWTTQTDTFDLASGQIGVLEITFCDVWCDPETSVEVTKPDGTVDTFGPLPDFFTGALAAYYDVGTYSVEKIDTWGDGGMGLIVANGLGNFSGVLEVDEFVYEDTASGHVGAGTDTSDLYALTIPQNYVGNLTLHWEDSSTNLDLRLYTDYDIATDSASGLLAYSFIDQPEFIDMGQIDADSMFYVEVTHYSGPATGYILDYQTQPGSPPPCFFQDDGVSPGDGSFEGSGEDAPEGSSTPDETPLDVTGHASDNSDGTWTGEFTGMLCEGYDDEDWFSVTVPENYGAHVMLEWPEGVDSNFNESLDIEGLLEVQLFMMTSGGIVSTVTYPQYNIESNPIAAATNESYSWTNELAYETDLYIRVGLEYMTADYESNYTVTFSLYNTSHEPWQLACQNDGNLANLTVPCVDAGSSATDAADVPTVNHTFSGYGHDVLDMYDYYRIEVPNNYLITLCVDFPAQNDLDVALYYQNPTWGWMSTISSSYYDNPECVFSQFDDAGQDLWLRVHTDVGSGMYDVHLTVLTPGLEPGGDQDDCGLAGSAPAGDAADYVYPGAWSGHTFLNDSTAGDFNPYNADGSVKSTPWEGGQCTAWIDKTWDYYDYYSVAVPENHYIQLDYDMDPEDDDDMSTVFSGVYLYFCQTQNDPCGPANLAYYMEYVSGTGIDEGTLTSGLFPVGTFHNASGILPAAGGVPDTPGWAYIGIYTSSFSGLSDATYEMNITFHPLSELEGGDQNDANSGVDAGTGVLSAVIVDNHMNQTQNDTLANDNVLGWLGWSHGAIDTTDVYFFTVPANHGMEIDFTCNEWTNSNDSCDAYFFFYAWQLTGMGGYLGAAGTSGSHTYNTSMYATNVDSVFGIGAYNWYAADQDGDGYAFNVTFFTLDADNDGWLDQTELDCGTDPNDANSTPNDNDGDGICDFLDPDDDNDGTDDFFDGSPNDPDSTSDIDGDGISDELDPDVDGDGWDNLHEKVCIGETSNAHLDANVTPSDYDGDGYAPNHENDTDDADLCDIDRALWYTTDEDNDGVDDFAVPQWVYIDVVSEIGHAQALLYLDTDGDDDGTDDETDAFDFDECADTDTDGDGQPDTIVADCVTDLVEDLDDDKDGHDDAYELLCLSDPLDETSMPIDSTLDLDLDDDGINVVDDDGNALDTEGDGYSNGLCDELDPDDDNDGVNDTEDLWPIDASEWSDADSDGLGDNRDMDDDGDGWWDSCDASAWLDAQASATIEGVNYFSAETDGIASNCPGQTDAFPNDVDEWIDTDGDGTGDNADVDDDGQGSTAEAAGNNDWTDEEEAACGTDPLDHTKFPLDTDGDWICDMMDLDDDGDGVNDLDDAFPLDQSESTDADGDGVGDSVDDDMDDDGWSNEDEAGCLTDPLDTLEVPTDNDGDGECDLVDGDDDNDGVIDVDDDFPFNDAETNDLDGDGVGDVADNDDDGDGWLDASEVACAYAGGSGDKNAASNTPEDLDDDGICDAIDTDDDGDGFPDPECVNTGIGSPSKLTYVECAEDDEDRFPRDSAEWFDANEDQKGDNANPVTLIDQVKFDPAPYVGIAVAIGAAGYGLLQMNRNAGQGSEDEAEDYTEEFEDFEFEDDEDPSDDDEDGEED